MTREYVEQKIAEASEGELTSSELNNLRKELKNWPDLQADFELIMDLPPISEAYKLNDISSFSYQISEIKHAIRKPLEEKDSFSEISLLWFRRYALAASILILAGSATLYMPGLSNESDSLEPALDEWIIPTDDVSPADTYVLYIDDLIIE